MWPQPMFMGGAFAGAELIYSYCSTTSSDPYVLLLPADVQDGDLLVQVCYEYLYQNNYSRYYNRVIPDANCVSVSPSTVYSTCPLIAHKFLRARDAGTTITLKPGISNGGLSWYTTCIYVFRGVNRVQPIRSVAGNDRYAGVGGPLGWTGNEGICSGGGVFPLAKDSIPFLVMGGGIYTSSPSTEAAIEAGLWTVTPLNILDINKNYNGTGGGWVGTAIPQWAGKNNLSKGRNLLKNSTNNWATDWTWVNAGMSGWPDQSNGVMYNIAVMYEVQTVAEEEHYIAQSNVMLNAGETYYLGLIADSGNISYTRTSVADGQLYYPAVGLVVEDDELNEHGFYVVWTGQQANITSGTGVGGFAGAFNHSLTGTGNTGYQHLLIVAVTPTKTGPHTFKYRLAWKRAVQGTAPIKAWSNQAGVTFTAAPGGFGRDTCELFCCQYGFPTADGWSSNLDSTIANRQYWAPITVGSPNLSSENTAYLLEITGTQVVDQLYPLSVGYGLYVSQARPGPYYDLLTDSIITDGQMVKSVNGTSYVYDTSVFNYLCRGYVEGGFNRRYFEWEVVNFVEPGTNETEIGFCSVIDSNRQITVSQADVGGGTYKRHVAKDDQTWVALNTNLGDLAGTPFQNGDVFGFALDFENNRYRFYKNNVMVREAALYSFGGMRGQMWRPYAIIGFSGDFSQYRIRLRNTIYTPPEGYVVWDNPPTEVPPTYTEVVKIFTADDVWQKPPNMKWARLIAVGGGGGGGAGPVTTGNSVGGSGGGAGGWDEEYLLYSEIPEGTHAVTIGLGGAGGVLGTFANAYADGVPAANGGTTSIGSLVSAGGGQGGPVVSGTGTFAGGNGGSGKWAGAEGGDASSSTTAGVRDGFDTWNYGGGAGGGGGMLNGSTYGEGGNGGNGGVRLPEGSRPAGGAGAVALNNLTAPTPANPGDPGGAGIIDPLIGYYMGGGGGGGGGTARYTTAQANDTCSGGRGGDGGWPGGGGGGGGVIRTPTTANQLGGPGGDGADGMAVVVEYYDPTAAYRAGYIFYEETLNPTTPRTVNYPPEVQPGDLIVFTAEGVIDIDFSLLPAGHVVISKYVSGTNAIGYFNGAQTMCMWWAGNETSITVSRTGIGNDVAAGAIIAYRNINPNVVIGHLDGTTGQSGRIEVVSPTNLVGSPVNPVPNYGSLLGSSDSSANDSIHLWHYFTGELDDLDAANFDTFGDHVNFLIPPFINNPANSRRSGVLELPANQRTITNLLTNSLNPGTGGWTPHNIDLASYTTTTYYNEPWWRCDMASGLPAGEFGGFYQTVNLEAGKTYTLAGCMGGAPRSFMGVDDGSGLWGYVWPDSLGAGVDGGFGTIPSDAYGFGVVTPGNAVALKMQAIRFTPTVTGPHDIWIGGAYADYTLEFPAGNRWSQLRMGYFSLTEDSFPWVTRPPSLYTSDGTNGTYTGGRGVPMRLTDAAVTAISNQRLEGLGMELLSTGRTPSAAKMQPLSFGYLSLRYSADKMEVTAPCSFTGSGNADTWASVSTPIAPYGFDAGPGKYQVEFQVLDIGTGFSVAVTNMHPPMDQTDSAVRNLLDELDCYSYRTTSGGQIYNGPTQVGTGLGAFATNDVVGVTVDMITNVISFYKNGVLLGSCTGVNATRYLRCVVNVGNSSSDSGSGTLRLNAAGTFSYPVAGFSPWQWW